MEKLKVLRWLLLVAGILYLIVGVMLFFTPLASLMGVALYIIISMLASGISEILAYATSEKEFRSGWMLASGILTTLLGIWLVFGQGMSAITVVLPFVFAAWMLSAGIMRTVGSFSLKSAGAKGWGWVLASGILGIIAGLILLFSPVLSGLIISYTIAAMFIIHGINDIVMFFDIGSLKKKIENFRKK